MKKKIVILIVVFVIMAIAFVGAVFFLKHQLQESEEKVIVEIREEEDIPVEEKTEQDKEEVEVEKENEEGPLPKEWDYVEEETVPISIANEVVVQDKIPDSKIEELKAELSKKLKEKNELRRMFEIREDTLQEDEQQLQFQMKFSTKARVRREVKVLYKKGEEVFTILVQEEE